MKLQFSTYLPMVILFSKICIQDVQELNCLRIKIELYFVNRNRVLSLKNG